MGTDVLTKRSEVSMLTEASAFDSHPGHKIDPRFRGFFIIKIQWAYGH